ncbi:lens fiber membrane intrinsic protein-like [Ambystoma mexicanum]|uniref:lens fiber membrane intrinsic protein-like n=1 Tax=Ambystoma mexicanum TaxID=8296 RepID=UPI0037E7463C
MSGLPVCSLFLLLISAILNVISLATAFWVTARNFNLGLWRICIGNICANLGSTAEIDSTRAFSIISFLLLLVAIVIQIREIWFRAVSGADKQKLTAILGFCAGASACIAMSVFTASARPSGGAMFSWSFALGWVSTVLSMVAGAVAFVAIKTDAH